MQLNSSDRNKRGIHDSEVKYFVLRVQAQVLNFGHFLLIISLNVLKNEGFLFSMCSVPFKYW